jgi:RNA-dependent RNA polymerase
MFNNLTFDPNSILCPARYPARLSQAFTAIDAVKVVVDEVINIDDICTSNSKYPFTDGVSTCSKEFSCNIWAQLKKTKQRNLPKEVPAAYQIRFMGSKGMIFVDHTLEGLAIGLRPSMVKFITPERCRTSKLHVLSIHLAPTSSIDRSWRASEFLSKSSRGIKMMLYRLSRRPPVP